MRDWDDEWEPAPDPDDVVPVVVSTPPMPRPSTDAERQGADWTERMVTVKEGSRLVLEALRGSPADVARRAHSCGGVPSAHCDGCVREMLERRRSR